MKKKAKDLAAEEMDIEVNLKYLIEVMVEMTVEHYVNEYWTDDRFQPSKKVREIKDNNIKLMKNSLINNLYNTLKKK